MSLIWLKAMVTQKGVNSEERTVEGMASTIQPDLIRDVILPSAWRKSLARWKKRGSIPKFLAYHMHRLLTGHSPVLGPMLKLNVVPEGLLLKAEFAETELGNEHLHLYGIGAMDYFSVGFQIRPGGATMVGDDVRRLLSDNGIRARVPEDVDRVITEAELLEVSAVVIGANLGALVTASANPSEACCGMCGEEGGKKCKTDEEKALRSMYAKRILERLELCASIIPDGSGKAIHEDEEKLLPETPYEFKGIWLPAGVDDKAHPLENASDLPDEDEGGHPHGRIRERENAELEEGIDELVHPKLLAPSEGKKSGGTTTKTGEPEGTVEDPLTIVKRATPYANLPTAPEDQRWNPRGTPDSRLINAILGPDGDNWARYKKANMWWDGEGGKLAAYKLKVARMFKAADPNNVAPSGGTLTVIWRQLASRMAILMGARGGVDIPAAERRGVYNHMVRYYRKLDKEPPEFRDYTPEELKSLEEQGRVVLPETLEKEQRGVDRDLLHSILERVEALESREAERETESKTFLETLAKAVEAKASTPGGTGCPEHQTVPPEGEQPETDGGLKVLEGILENLEHLSGPKPD